MSSVDELLDSFESEDESLEDTKVESKPFAELRGHARKLEKQLRSYEKELSELRSFREERVKAERTAAVESTFKDVGLNPKHAKLWAALNPEAEPTAEAVAGFAAEYGLVTENGEQVEAPAPPSFTPTLPTGAGPAQATKISRAEFRQMYDRDPANALKLLEQGRVETEVADFARPLG